MLYKANRLVGVCLGGQDLASDNARVGGSQGGSLGGHAQENIFGDTSDRVQMKLANERLLLF